MRLQSSALSLAPRRVQLTLFLTSLLCLLPATTLLAGTDTYHPRPLMPGLQWIRWNGGSVCRAGDPGIGVLIVDPERFRFKVLHYQQAAQSGPLTIWEWHERTRLCAIFNAGQYYPDYSYMGLLIIQGRAIGHTLHRLFKALFMAEPVDQRAPKAKIIDLSKDAFDPERPGYLNVAQSFMLLDRSGTIRVQKTSNAAHRTVVAEGHGGEIWIFVSQGAYTLWEFGRLLQSSPFPLRQAMSMDGGSEAQMLVKVSGFLFDSLGPWDETAQRGRRGTLTRRPLPTVIGISPRKD